MTYTYLTSGYYINCDFYYDNLELASDIELQIGKYYRDEDGFKWYIKEQVAWNIVNDPYDYCI